MVPAPTRITLLSLTAPLPSPLHGLGVELLGPLRALEDSAELLSHPLDLFIREPETGQVRNVAYLLLGYHLSPPALSAQRDESILAHSMSSVATPTLLTGRRGRKGEVLPFEPVPLRGRLMGAGRIERDLVLASLFEPLHDVRALLLVLDR